MPMPESPVLTCCAASPSMRTMWPSPSGYARAFSVGVSSLARTLPASFTMPAAIFVPPMSTAPIISCPLSFRAWPLLPAIPHPCILKLLELLSVTTPLGTSGVLILPRLFRQQPALVFHDVGRKTEGIAIRSREARQPLRRELRRNDVNQKLPLGGNRGKLKQQITGIVRKFLTDQHDARAELPQVACDGEILFAQEYAVDPYAKANIFADDFLRTMPERPGAHSCRWRFDAFFPNESRFIGAAEARAARQKVSGAVRREPNGGGNLLLPSGKGALNFCDRSRKRVCELRIVSRPSLGFFAGLHRTFESSAIFGGSHLKCGNFLPLFLVAHLAPCLAEFGCSLFI